MFTVKAIFFTYRSIKNKSASNANFSEALNLSMPGAVEVLNRMSCLESSLGKVFACVAGGRRFSPRLWHVCLGALLEDPDSTYHPDGDPDSDFFHGDPDPAKVVIWKIFH
jgi:hypothetical protein